MYVIASDGSLYFSIGVVVRFALVVGVCFLVIGLTMRRRGRKRQL